MLYYVEPILFTMPPGCAATLEQAKAELQANWRKWLVWARLEEPTVPNDHH